MEAHGVDEGEHELGCTTEMEEELDEKVPKETYAAAGEELQRRLGRVEGAVVREEEQHELVGSRERGDRWSARRWGMGVVSAEAVHAADPPAVGKGGGMVDYRDLGSCSVQGAPAVGRCSGVGRRGHSSGCMVSRRPAAKRCEREKMEASREEGGVSGQPR